MAGFPGHARSCLQQPPADVPGPSGPPGAGLCAGFRAGSTATICMASIRRIDSFFSNSVDGGAAAFRPGRELALLEPYRSQCPDEVFDTPTPLPTTDGSGNIRASLREAGRHAGRGRLGGARRRAGQRRHRRTADLRDPAEERLGRAGRRQFRGESEAARRRGPRAHGGERAVCRPHRDIRLRHDHPPMGGLVVSRQ